MPALPTQDWGTQGVAVEFARNRDECAERMVHPQHGHAGRNARLEAFTDQTGARLGRSQLIGIFQISKNVRCIGPAHRAKRVP